MQFVFRIVITGLLFLFFVPVLFAQSENNEPKPRGDYQIYLPKPVKEIKQLLYYKDCSPIDGIIPEGGKKVIMKNFEPGNKVYVEVIYTDGTSEEFTRSPCFIDPVLL
ncbi:MAG: hypothetical protein KIS94_10645 [Chitinophagales bacterium]|nr:hypothetical protein [Chitinophagales bacterium]